MPKVRASSGMIGTIRGPISGSLNRSLSSRTKAIVVATSCLPEPRRTTSYTGSPGSTSAFAALRRSGTEPPSACRRSAGSAATSESGPGWKYGGSLASIWSSGIGICSRSRKATLRSSRVSFFIWWVALRPSKWLPSVQPLMVLARITVGWPGVLRRGAVGGVQLAVVVAAARSAQISSSVQSSTILRVRGSRPKKCSRTKAPFSAL